MAKHKFSKFSTHRVSLCNFPKIFNFFQKWQNTNLLLSKEFSNFCQKNGGHFEFSNSKNFPILPKNGGHFPLPNFRKFCQRFRRKSLQFSKNFPLAKHKFPSISLTVRDRAISSKFSTHRVSKECNLCNFQKIFPSPKMAAILNFRIFAKNGKTQICFYLLNRAR